VKLLDEMVSRFDSIVLRSVSDEELQNRDKEFVRDAGLYSNTMNRSIYEAYDSIDTKATAILQHVSIMIVATGFLYSLTSVTFLKILFGAETLLYVVLALFCLRLFMHQNHSKDLSETMNVVARESILDLTAKLTFLISLFLIGTVALELVIR
jgi:hypothetical protein